MENFVRKALDEYGITPSQAHKLGMPYQSVYRQYRGQRRPSGEFALLYEELLGIPREKIRPDLWPPEPAPAREEVSALDGNLFARRVELKDAMEADKGQ